MPNKGWWGDKIIIALSGHDEKRNKRWCEHYRKGDNYCTEQICKCQGSAHCNYYKKKYGLGPIDYEEVPKLVPRVEIKEGTDADFRQERKPAHFTTYIPGHYPLIGDKLLGQVVLIKRLGGKVVFGEVISEDREYFTVDRDDGTTKKYNRRIVFQSKSIWVLDNC